MRVLMLTQALDPADPLLAFTVDWVNALAARVEHLDVLCLRSCRPALAANVATWTIGAREQASRGRRLLAFERAVWRLTRGADVVFGHMVPRYVCAAAPAAFARDRGIVFWYVHRQVTAELRLAVAASRFVATAVPGSFPFATSKLRTLGHGVDAGFFAPGHADTSRRLAADNGSPSIVFVGRLMPVKHQATLLRALARLHTRHSDARAIFVGGVPDGHDTVYARGLKDLVQQLGLGSRVAFTGPLPPAGVRDVLRRARVAVNLSPAGLFDKAALEAMMTGVPTIAASPAFDDVFGAHASRLRIGSPDDDQRLANVIEGLLDLSPEAARRIGEEVRQRAVAAHGRDGMMDRLVELMHVAASGA
jgi:glycosyltransferase involved in cell wall biosynthesis